MPLIQNTPSVWTAFIAGIFSFFSPCLLPMMPAYIMYLQSAMGKEASAATADTTDEQARDAATQKAMKQRVFRSGLIRAIGFIAGFTLVFMLLGFSASFIGQFLARNKAILSKIAGAFIVFFALNMLGILKLNFLTRDHRKFRGASSFGMGMAFAFGWTPCFGPILGAILASTAAVSSNVGQGMFLLFVYSMGLAIPFLLTYIFLTAFESNLSRLSKHAVTVNRVGGVIMLIFGILILTDTLGALTNVLTQFGSWLRSLIGLRH
ncbi:MAG: cytochrome c biogenesis CcdA family protein [Bacillota bacterium]|nr:cytochrome c biogenesis CcdA family protein [Bacillota bacterium]